jgi:hypothetical protein
MEKFRDIFLKKKIPRKFSALSLVEGGNNVFPLTGIQPAALSLFRSGGLSAQLRFLALSLLDRAALATARRYLFFLSYKKNCY